MHAYLDHSDKTGAVVILLGFGITQILQDSITIFDCGNHILIGRTTPTADIYSEQELYEL